MDWYFLGFDKSAFADDPSPMKGHVVCKELKAPLIKDLITRGSGEPRVMLLREADKRNLFIVDYGHPATSAEAATLELDRLKISVPAPSVSMFMEAIRRNSEKVRYFENGDAYHKLHFVADCLVLTVPQMLELKSQMTVRYGRWLSRSEMRL